MTRRRLYTEEEIAWVGANKLTRTNIDAFRVLFERPDANYERLKALRKYRGLPTPQRVENYVLSRDGYVMVVSDGRQRLKHKVLWEQRNGPVPKGMKLNCIDRNRANFDPSNWEALPAGVITRATFIKRRIGNDPELRPTIVALATLQTKLAEANRAKFPQDREPPPRPDAIVGDSDGFTLLDTIADDSASSWLEEMGATVW